jgi:hypothetical protein
MAISWTGLPFRLAIAALALVLAGDLAWLAMRPAWMMIPAALAGWYAADLMSGAIHMYMDYRPSRAGIGLDRLFFYEGPRNSADYVAMRDAVFGQLGPLERLIYDFKNHHPRPDALGRRTMVHQIGSTIAFTTLPVALLANLVLVTMGLAAWAMAGLVAFLIGASFAQYFHGTLHRSDVPPPVRAMRATRLLMRPEDHVAHHRTLAQDFSTINGWSNPALNRVFRALRQRGHLPDEGLVPR